MPATHKPADTSKDLVTAAVEQVENAAALASGPASPAFLDQAVSEAGEAEMTLDFDMFTTEREKANPTLYASEQAALRRDFRKAEANADHALEFNPQKAQQGGGPFSYRSTMTAADARIKRAAKRAAPDYK